MNPALTKYKGKIATERKLARYLARLPDESLIRLARTEEQKQEWFDRRDYNKLLSRCWLGRIQLPFPNDPLADGLESGKIPEAVHRQIYARVRFLQALWGVIQIGERHIKREAKRIKADYPFSSAFNLFIEILKTGENDLYEACLESHSSHEIPKLRTGASICRAYMENGFKLAINPEQFCGIADSYYFQNYWFVFALEVCHAKAEQDGTLRDEMSAFYKCIGSHLEFTESWLSRNRDSKKYPKLHTIHWIDGEKHKVKRS